MGLAKVSSKFAFSGVGIFSVKKWALNLGERNPCKPEPFIILPSLRCNRPLDQVPLVTPRDRWTIRLVFSALTSPRQCMPHHAAARRLHETAMGRTPWAESTLPASLRSFGFAPKTTLRDILFMRCAQDGRHHSMSRATDRPLLRTGSRVAQDSKNLNATFKTSK